MSNPEVPAGAIAFDKMQVKRMPPSRVGTIEQVERCKYPSNIDDVTDNYLSTRCARTHYPSFFSLSTRTHACPYLALKSEVSLSDRYRAVCLPNACAECHKVFVPSSSAVAAAPASSALSVIKASPYSFPPVDSNDRSFFNCGQFVADKSLARCVRCKSVWYCNKEHQEKHFPVHNLVCKSLKGVKDILYNAITSPLQLPYLPAGAEWPAIRAPPRPQSPTVTRSASSSKAVTVAITAAADAGADGKIGAGAVAGCAAAGDDDDDLGASSSESTEVDDFIDPVGHRQRPNRGARDSAQQQEHKQEVKSMKMEGSPLGPFGTGADAENQATSPTTTRDDFLLARKKWRDARRLQHYYEVTHERKLFDSVYKRVATAATTTKTTKSKTDDNRAGVSATQQTAPTTKTKLTMENTTYLIHRPQCFYCFHRMIDPASPTTTTATATSMATSTAEPAAQDASSALTSASSTSSSSTPTSSALVEEDLVRCPTCHTTTFCRSHFLLGMRHHKRARLSDPMARSHCDEALLHLQCQQVLRDCASSGQNPVWIPSVDEPLMARIAEVAKKSASNAAGEQLVFPANWREYWNLRKAPRNVRSEST